MGTSHLRIWHPSGSYPPAVNLRPSADWPDGPSCPSNSQVVGVIGRIAADVDELA
jgi:hypothetical protein